MTLRVHRGPEGHDDPAERLHRLRGLPLAAESADVLLEASVDPSPEVCVAALRRLALCGGAAQADAIRRRLLTCELSLVTEHARALRALGGGDPDHLLRDALADERYEPRLRAATALEELRDAAASGALREAAADPVSGVRRAALDALRALGRDPRAAAAARARLADPDAHVRAAAVRALAATADGALHADLTRVVADTSRVVRVEVARSIPRLATSAGTALLTDPDTGVRVAALATAGPAHLPSIGALLAGDRMPRVRKAAARALARIGDPGGASALVAALSDSDAFVRHAARRGLVELVGEARVTELLCGELGDAAPQRRRAALDALRALELLAPHAALAPLAHDPSIDVRLGLARVADPTILQALQEDADASVRDSAERRLPAEERR
jgi:HEAT repeat protein